MHKRGTTAVIGFTLLIACFSFPLRALACVVGTGTGDSCTEAALDACLPGGAGFTGAATFNCGSEALTITITSTKNISADTTIDGRGLVTISGGNSVRLFLVNGGVNFTIRNLAIANGNGVGTGDPIINTGGAIFNSGTLTVTNSTFSGNSAGENGSGGAILNESPGTLIVTNSTFSGNSAGGDGGGIENFDGTVTLTNTILANSSGGNCHGLFTDGGHNLQWPGTECGETIQSADPLLGPLADNGGPTDTMALLPNSPAIDAGDPDICANPPVNGVDQRGYRRPGTGSVVCSIGAYEYNSPGPCAGDCDGTGEVTSEDRITLLSVALGTAGPGECPDGDWTGDGAISVDELVLALNATPDVCPAFTPEQRCLASGGALSTAMCCLNAGDFPDTCSIGACSCAPVNSHEVRVCVCGESRCWDGSTCCPGGPSAHLAPAA